MLRLLCMFGIVAMHSFAGIDTSSSILNTELHVFFNSLFNTGVTCFILISGYFGITFNLNKLIRMDFMVIFFTVLGIVVTEEFGIKMIIKSCFPIITRQHWFISCYFVLCILTPFLNQIPMQMQKEKFRMLLIVMLGIFSVIPTFTTYDIMQDAGKGLVHFVMIYLLGRYLAIYKNKVYVKTKLLLGFFVCILIVFILDSVLTLSRGVIYTTFARDCSAFIILASVFLVFLFCEIHFYSRFINRMASNVLAITVLDSSLQHVFGKYFDLNLYGNSNFFVFIIIGYVLLVMITAILLNEIRRAIFGRIEQWLSERISKLLYKLFYNLFAR